MGAVKLDESANAISELEMAKKDVEAKASAAEARCIVLGTSL